MEDQEGEDNQQQVYKRFNNPGNCRCLSPEVIRYILLYNTLKQPCYTPPEAEGDKC